MADDRLLGLYCDCACSSPRRFITLDRPLGSSMMSGLDATFASRTTLTLAHINPATAFVVLAPFVDFRASERRWLERLIPELALVLTDRLRETDAIYIGTGGHCPKGGRGCSGAGQHGPTCFHRRGNKGAG